MSNEGAQVPDPRSALVARQKRKTLNLIQEKTGKTGKAAEKFLEDLLWIVDPAVVEESTTVKLRTYIEIIWNTMQRLKQGSKREPLSAMRLPNDFSE